MGALSFSTLKEELKLRCGNRADLEAAGDSSLNYYGVWINSAYRMLCTQDRIMGLPKRLYFPELMTSTTKTTTDGTAYVTDPSDILYATEIYDTTHNSKLSQISWKEYIGYTGRTTAASEGYPTEWVRYGGKIYLYPTPQTTGDTMTIYYKKRVADLSGTGTTVIGAEWDDVIIELGAYKAFTWLHEYDKAQKCKESFIEMAGGLANIYSLEEIDRDSTIGPSMAYVGK